MIQFANLWFLLLIPVIAFLFWALRRKKGLRFSSVALLRGAGKKATKKHIIGKILTLCGLAMCLVAMARPQTTQDFDFIRQHGVDIAMLLDVSGSMMSVDFEPNRLEAARKTIDDFVSERLNDRISLIIFAGEAFTRIPLTLDNNVVRESLADVATESVNRDGTAIGMAISVGLNRLRGSDAASRIMILVTDGDNNAGVIDPMTASNLAKDLGIRIYTIGIGSDTMILPVQDFFGRTTYQRQQGGFDESLLMRIAETTGGRYYRAIDMETLEGVFDAINELEKTEFEGYNYREYNELAYPFIMAALALLFVGIVLDKFYFVQIP